MVDLEKCLRALAELAEPPDTISIIFEAGNVRLLNTKYGDLIQQGDTLEAAVIAALVKARKNMADSVGQATKALRSEERRLLQIDDLLGPGANR